MLEADAEFWWNGVKRLLEEAQAKITWNVFKDAFHQKYFPPSIRNAKELEFMQLCKEITVFWNILPNLKNCAKFPQFISVIQIKHGNVLNSKVD